MWQGHTYFIYSSPNTPQDLRTRVSRQVEDQSSEKREQHAGNDDVDDEIQRQP